MCRNSFCDDKLVEVFSVTSRTTYRERVVSHKELSVQIVVTNNTLDNTLPHFECWEKIIRLKMRRH